MKRLTPCSLLLTLMLFSAPASAAVVGWGAATTNSTVSNCPSNGLCSTENNGDFAFNDDGGRHQSSAASNETTYGTSRAASALSGTTFTPNLQAYAKADDEGGAFALAMGVQGYTYAGQAKTITLDLNLSAVINDGSEGRAEALARVAVIFTNDLFFSPFFGTLSEAAPSGSIRETSQTVLRITSSTNGNFHQISFDVLPGDEFLVWAGLEAKAWRGAEADAFSTLTMNFDDPTGLSAAGADSPPVSAVPLPAGAWLFLSGLALLGGLRRRTRRVAC